ncbi:MAG: spondin domain-containing protein [Pseudomonadota bacterium]
MGHTTLVTALTLATGLAAASMASAASLKITITNTASIGGFSLTPVYSTAHDGSFDAFDVGDDASAGVELIAELGDPGGLPVERLADDPNSTATVIAAPANGVGTIDPGETTTAFLHLTEPSQRFFTFLSMLVPSNDTFLGNDDALEIIDAAGNYLGDQTIILTGLDLYDAGTEANDLNDGAAFVALVDGASPSVPATGGTVTSDKIQLASTLDFGLNNAITTPVGLLDPALTDFMSDPSGFGVARIEIAAVPLPAAAPMLAGALILMGALRRRRG